MIGMVLGQRGSHEDIGDIVLQGRISLWIALFSLHLQGSDVVAQGLPKRVPFRIDRELTIRRSQVQLGMRLEFGLFTLHEEWQGFLEMVDRLFQVGVSISPAAITVVAPQFVEKSWPMFLKAQSLKDFQCSLMADNRFLPFIGLFQRRYLAMSIPQPFEKECMVPWEKGIVKESQSFLEALLSLADIVGLIILFPYEIADSQLQISSRYPG